MMMKKIAILLGLFAFLVFMGTASATTYYCDNCTNCTDAIAGASAGDIIKVTQNFNYSEVYGSPSCQGMGMCFMYGNEEDCNNDPECSWISPVLDYCIGFGGNNKTFDCQNYTLTGTTNKWGIDATASNSTIRNCILDSWSYYGIRLAGSDNLLNNIQARNSGSGVYVQYSSKNTINGSNFSYNSVGVYLRTSSLINITNSEFGSNINGITFVDSSLNMIDNTTIKNSDSGLYFTYDSASYTNNTIKNSRIYGCNISINLPHSNYPSYWIYDNLFYNNLLNSTANAYIVDATHQTQYWNVTATSGTNIVGRNQIGGNYWAYPNGTGYSQTCNNTNNDSFCDSSYTFNPTDYLPLTLNQPAAVTLNLTFVSPTPSNGTTINSTSFTANVSSNGTVSSCTFTLDGTNYSMTIASGNLSASKANSALSQGIHRYNATCDGFMTETRTLAVDSVAPTITIYSPQNITYNGVSQAYLNVSASEAISTWWYSINGGSNTTFTPNITINIANGSNILFIYANDTIGNIGQASVSFTGNYPTVTYLNSPDDGNETISSVPISMTFNCSAINDVNLANITLYLNGIPNETRSVTGIYNFSIFTKTLSLGDYNWTCRACDYASQCSFGIPTRTLSIASPPSPMTGYMTSVTRGFLLLIPLLIAVVIILLMLGRLEALNLESLIEMGVIVIVLIALTVVLSTII